MELEGGARREVFLFFHTWHRPILQQGRESKYLETSVFGLGFNTMIFRSSLIELMRGGPGFSGSQAQKSLHAAY